MARNNVDQAPKIKSIGEKSPACLKDGRNAWGSAIRPHELETIFANCLGDRAFSQYKVMMFLTGCAEEKFDVSIANVEKRCGISKDTYYKARKDLIKKGWLSIEEDNSKSYIIINYDKIYQDGKDICGLSIADEGRSLVYADESRSLNIPDEGRSMIISDEGRLLNYSDEQSRSLVIPVDSKNEQGRSMICEEGRSINCEQGRLGSSQYNINNNKIRDKINNAIDSEQSRLKNYSDEGRLINTPVNEEDFKKEWGGCMLTGAAANF